MNFWNIEELALMEDFASFWTCYRCSTVLVLSFLILWVSLLLGLMRTIKINIILCVLIEEYKAFL